MPKLKLNHEEHEEKHKSLQLSSSNTPPLHYSNKLMQLFKPDPILIAANKSIFQERPLCFHLDREEDLSYSYMEFMKNAG